MITRIVKLPRHNNVLVGRDLAEIFENGKVYEIKKFGDEYVITCLGDSALPDHGPQIPNAHSEINSIMSTSVYAMTKEEFKEIYVDAIRD